MKITRVAYRHLVSGTSFSNTAIEAEASVDEGESIESVLMTLKVWVHGQLGLNETADPRRLAANRLREVANDLEFEIPF